jgi:hypothetical protein
MSDAANTLKQAVPGFKVVNVNVKKGKETEKVKLILEANVEDISAGEFDVGDVISSLMNTMTAEQDIGLSVFIKK